MKEIAIRTVDLVPNESIGTTLEHLLDAHATSVAVADGAFCVGGHPSPLVAVLLEILNCVSPRGRCDPSQGTRNDDRQAEACIGKDCRRIEGGANCSSEAATCQRDGRSSLSRSATEASAHPRPNRASDGKPHRPARRPGGNRQEEAQVERPILFCLGIQHGLRKQFVGLVERFAQRSCVYIARSDDLRNPALSTRSRLLVDQVRKTPGIILELTDVDRFELDERLAVRGDRNVRDFDDDRVSDIDG